MNILVLGGGGYYGQKVAEHLSHHPNIQKIVLAGRDLAALSLVKEKLGDKVITYSLDATNASEIERGLCVHDCRLTLNCAGRYFETLFPALEACLSAGSDYMDLSEDWILFERAQETYCSLFEQNKSLALLGMGTVPGLTNLWAMLAAGLLDQCTRLETGFYVSPQAIFPDRKGVENIAASGKIPPVLEIALRSATGDAKVRRNGKASFVKAFSRTEMRVVQGNDGLCHNTFPVAMSPPATLHNKHPLCEHISTLIGFESDEIHNVLAEFTPSSPQITIDEALPVLEHIAALIEKVTSREILAERFVLAKGIKDKQEIMLKVSDLPMVSADVALAGAVYHHLQLAQSARGVRAPEDCFVPLPYLATLNTLPAVKEDAVSINVKWQVC